MEFEPSISILFALGLRQTDNKQLLEALRNEPDRYLLIDKMQLTPFTTTTIINYNSFLTSRRPPQPQGNEQFIGERVLETAARIFGNLQKGIVDSTISTAAGLEKDSSYSATTYQALPYYESSSHLPTYLRQNSSDAEEISTTK